MKLDRRVGRCLCVLLILASTQQAAAQEGRELSEGEFVAAAMSESAVEVATMGERGLAAADLLHAALWPSPNLEVAREEPRGTTRESSAAIRWALPFDGRRALRQRAAEIGLGAADLRVDAARARLRLELSGLYANWVVAWERRNLLASQVERIERLAETANARARAGESSGLSARRFDLESATFRADLARAEAELASVESEVQGWLDPAVHLDMRPRSPELPSPPERGDSSLVDLAARSDLAALARDVERAEVQALLSEKWLEAPELTLGWKRLEERGAPSVSFSGPVFGLGWSLPLRLSRFDRRSADRSEAGARLKVARAALELAQRRARAERGGALAAYVRLREAASEAERVAESSVPLLRSAEVSFQLGESGLTDLLDTLRAGLGARLTALDLRAAALAARRDLETALGRSLEGENR